MDEKIWKYYCSYQRPPGPINIWKVVQGSLNGKAVKFSIQEIPEDRYDDVVEHMCTDFLNDEIFFYNFKVKDNPEAREEIRILWKEMLKCGMCIGAFVDNSESGKPLIAGANMLHVSHTEGAPDRMEVPNAFKTKNLQMVMKLMAEIASGVDLDKVYSADKYLVGLGLSVGRNFRGMSLGGHILSARDFIGQKYGIPVAVTVFSANAAIKLAERTGYECLVKKASNELVNEKGKLYFPNCKSKYFLFMGKRLEKKFPIEK